MLLGWLGLRLGLDAYYAAGLALAAGFALYQHCLARGRDPELCFAAFLNNAWFGASVMLGIVLAYL